MKIINKSFNSAPYYKPSSSNFINTKSLSFNCYPDSISNIKYIKIIYYNKSYYYNKYLNYNDLDNDINFVKYNYIKINYNYICSIKNQNKLENLNIKCYISTEKNKPNNKWYKYDSLFINYNESKMNQLLYAALCNLDLYILNK